MIKVWGELERSLSLLRVVLMSMGSTSSFEGGGGVVSHTLVDADVGAHGEGEGEEGG